MDPQVIELDYDQLQAKLEQIEAVIGPEVAQPFRQLLQWYTVLLQLVRDKTMSIKRLQNLLFGSSSERTAKVLPPSSSDQPEENESSSEQADQQQTSSSDLASAGSDSEHDDTEPSPPPPGHGRIAAADYTGCAQVIVTHDVLRAGDNCPRCVNGTLYHTGESSPAVRLKGQPPVGGTVYQREQLRCNLCSHVHIADLPEEAGPDKFDASVASVIATLRYGQGFPWNRIQRFQQSAGIPLPASTQWEIVRDALPRGIQAAYEHLLHVGAQGELMHNDDTTMRVLSLTACAKNGQPLLEHAPERRGVFTSNILSRAEGRPAIALFFTGPQHCGENLRDVLRLRQEALPPPIQMCDGLSRSMPADLSVILANCLVHGRRKFVEVVEVFKNEVEYVLKCLAKVYQIDAEAKQQQLSPQARLHLHQQQSGPVMEELHTWLQRQLDEKLVEPNSSLGGAINYMLRHWEKLTLFLRVAGAPLDNNICERALKMAIRHRRNSLFYKTMRGALVGDIYMSLIHTCYFSAADPFDYLTQLQRNHERVTASPGNWMPWNYRQQLVRGAASADGTPSAHPPDG